MDYSEWVPVSVHDAFDLSMSHAHGFDWTRSSASSAFWTTRSGVTHVSGHQLSPMSRDETVPQSAGLLAHGRRIVPPMVRSATDGCSEKWFRGEGSNPYMQDQNLPSY
ncbi:MAG TPA: hypothetical protein PLP26_11645, partial [Ilumatobacteraceae bacterium]|nr:hypothetical protein [Ilumatobacteraceae bacterium]